MTTIQKTVIHPNFSVITEYMPNLASAAMGVFFAHGSRNEDKTNNGITHLIEHMLFKGTKNKSAKDIACIVESAGAVIDGFTGNETSGIYARFLATEYDKMLGLLGEIISLSQFDAQELEKEKNVVSQEIKEDLDDPGKQVFTLLFESLFEDHPLSLPVAGNINTVQQFTRSDLINYYRKQYLPSRVCISAAGKIDHSALVDSLSKDYHKLLPSRPTNPPVESTLRREDPTREADKPPPRRTANREPRTATRPDLTQLHFAFANFTIPYKDIRRYGLVVLNSIMGGSLSSRLFQRLREQEGLVYSVFSFVDFFSDIGLMGGYMVSEAKNRERIFNATLDELMKLKRYGVTKEEKENAVNYCNGMLVLGLEDPMSRMARNAKNELLLNQTISVEDAIKHFDNLSLDDINNLTSDPEVCASLNPGLTPGQASGAIAMVGPITEKDLGKIKVAPSSESE